jgi:hypothetical protein
MTREIGSTRSFPRSAVRAVSVVRTVRVMRLVSVAGTVRAVRLGNTPVQGGVL